MTPSTPLRPRALLSYAYFAKHTPDSIRASIQSDTLPEVMLDSGAFTAFTKGKVISITEYAAWVRKWQGETNRYIALDVIGNAEASYVNQQRMLDLGLRPVPVFHAGENFSWLERYISEGYRLIALGGIVPHSKRPNAMLPWLVRCFQMGKPHGVVYHGLGVSGFRLIKPLPWYSVDSSGWTFVFRTRQMPVFDERAGKFVYYLRGTNDRWKVADTIRRYGFDPNIYATSAGMRGGAHEDAVAELMAVSYMTCERFLRRVHGPVVHPDEPDAEPGLKLFLVDTYERHYRGMMRVAARQREEERV